LAIAENLMHPRSLSFTLVGIHAYLARFSGDSEVRRIRETLARRLLNKFITIKSDTWPWHDELVTYANAKIPQALLLSGQWLADQAMTEKGFDLLDWLITLQSNDGLFSPIGNRGWLKQNGQKARFDQQPIEAHAMIETCLLAYRMSSESNYFDMAKRSFDWFLGYNDLHVSLYDFKTGGCRDGLTPDGANMNQGAESTLAWLLSLVSMHAFLAEHKKMQYVDSIHE
jgi:hypothetical protein